MVIEKTKQTSAFIDYMHNGDSRCNFKIGQRVVKSYKEEKDIHQIGDEGEVTGSIYTTDSEAYLVKFDSDVIETFVLGIKLKKV